VYPEHANVVILTTYDIAKSTCCTAFRHTYGATIAEDRSQGNKILLQGQSEVNTESALRDLLHSTNKLVKKVIEHAPTKRLAVKTIGRDDAIAKDHRKETRSHAGKSERSSKKKARKRSHTSLSDLD
jgi:hypothetical protein